MSHAHVVRVDMGRMDGELSLMFYLMGKGINLACYLSYVPFKHSCTLFCRPNGEAVVSSYEKPWLLSIFIFFLTRYLSIDVIGKIGCL